MSRYRISIVGKAGHVVDVYEPLCVSDEEASHKAELLAQGRPVDIWQGDRWVAWFDPLDPAKIAPAHHRTSMH
jgi:hypothetical protein